MGRPPRTPPQPMKPHHDVQAILEATAMRYEHKPKQKRRAFWQWFFNKQVGPDTNQYAETRYK